MRYLHWVSHKCMKLASVCGVSIEWSKAWESRATLVHVLLIFFVHMAFFICLIFILHEEVFLQITNMFRIKTMYVYHIDMKIYLLDSINVFSSFYCPYITSWHTILLSWTTHKQYQIVSKLKSEFFSQFYYLKFYIHITIYFSQVKVFPKVTNTHLYIIQKKAKQAIS
jgi:hypothetical protein